MKRLLLIAGLLLFAWAGVALADLDDLSEETSPAADDLVYLGKNTGPGAFVNRKVKISNLVPTEATEAEINAGAATGKYVSPDALNGSKPALGGGTVTSTLTDTTGTVYGFDTNITHSPSSSSDAITVGSSGRLIASNTSAITGDGHGVGVLGYFGHNTTTTYPLAIGLEALLQKLTSGTISEADGVLSLISSNQGTLTEANGLAASVADNDGTITEFNGCLVKASNDTGTITTINGVRVAAVTTGTGGITNLTGFKFDNQTVPSGDVKLIDNEDPDAEIETKGSIVLEGSTSGSATVQATATGGHLDIGASGLAKSTQELLLFSDVASAVNELTVENAATGTAPEIKASGDDTNIDIKLTPKGSGKVDLSGIKYPTSDGSDNHVLMTDGAGLAAFASITDALDVVTGKFTRSADAASGEQAITGLGGTPIFILFQFTNMTAFVESSLGFTDCTNDYSTFNNAGVTVQADDAIYFNHASASTDLQQGRVDSSNGSCDSDGFTVDWLKTGSPPAETMTITYAALVRK